MDYNNQPRPEHKAGDADGCTGGWKCASCGQEIDSLPFKPRSGGENTLKCRDCFRTSRQR